MLKKCKANNAEAIQFHAPKLGVVEQLHTRYKSIKFRGNLKNECILLVGLTWNYPYVTQWWHTVNRSMHDHSLCTLRLVFLAMSKFSVFGVKRIWRVLILAFLKNS